MSHSHNEEGRLKYNAYMRKKSQQRKKLEKSPDEKDKSLQNKSIVVLSEDEKGQEFVLDQEDLAEEFVTVEIIQSDF